jgi:HEAT repeat protein
MTTLADLEPVLAKIAAWEPAQPRDPLHEFETFLRQSIAEKTELPLVEARLLRMIAPKAATTQAGKDFICRQLSLIGTRASVPSLARMLNDPADAAIALYALARIPDPSAAEALRNALPKTARVLGQRRDRKAVAALSRLLASPDGATFEAAVQALSQIGDAASLAALRASIPRATGTRRDALLHATVRCADAVAASGDKTTARSACFQLSALNEPVPIRIAALRGLAAIDGKAALPLLAKELAAANADVSASAIGLLNRIPGSEVTALFLKHYAALPPMAQARILAALGDRGDPAARPLAIQAVRSTSPDIRLAALAALGRIGDASTVSLLAETAAGSAGAEQAAARDSLAMLRGSAVDTAIAKGIGSSTASLRLELIRAAGERATPESADALMTIARGSDPEPALAAIRALRHVAGPNHAPALLDTVIRIENASMRREAALTLASVMKRAREPAVAPVLAAYSSAAKPVKLTLIDMMGQVSAPESLPLLRAAIKDADQELARAAILALTAWQTPEPLPDLLDLARNDTNATRQILALRGFIKVISAPSDRPPAESVAHLKEAWRLARQPAEKRAVLALLPLYPTTEALRIAEQAAADMSVAREAKAASESIRALGVQ